MKRKGTVCKLLMIVVASALVAQGWLRGQSFAVKLTAQPVHAVGLTDGEASMPPLALPANGSAPSCSTAEPNGLSQRIEPSTLYRDLSSPLHRNPNYLTAWSQSSLDVLYAWLDAGVRFEGRWSSEDLCLIVSVLNTAGTSLGYARFIDLVHTAVTTGSQGQRQHLTFRRLDERSKPPTGWLPTSATVLMKNTLFDRRYMTTIYLWHFLKEPAYAHLPPAMTVQKIAVAHEIGHILIDGLRAEYAASGYGELALGVRYIGTVPASQWPHPNYHPNESLATEIGMWALGMDRPADVVAFRSSYLAPTMTSATWPQALTAGLAPAPGLASR